MKRASAPGEGHRLGCVCFRCHFLHGVCHRRNIAGTCEKGRPGGCDHVDIPDAEALPSRNLSWLHRGHDVGQPSRRERKRQDFRAPDLRVRGVVGGSHCVGPGEELLRKTWHHDRERHEPQGAGSSTESGRHHRVVHIAARFFLRRGGLVRSRSPRTACRRFESRRARTPPPRSLG